MLKLLLLRAACSPVDLLALIVVWLVTRGARAQWLWGSEVLIVKPSPQSWLARRWRYSTTLGHVVLLHPLHNIQTLQHELVHVEQVHTACCLWWLVTALSFSPWLALFSPFAWACFYLSSCVATWLTGGHPYRENVLERHAWHETRGRMAP